MSNNNNFWLSPQAAAIYKHELIKRYVPAWAGKVGSTSAGGRVIVYDAYAGPGRYEDAEPGSPEIIVDTAIALKGMRSIYTIFSDKDQAYCDRLRTMLTDKAIPLESFDILRGPVEVNIGGVVNGSGDFPLFVFLDPYGFTLPFDYMTRLLRCRDKPGHYSTLLQPKTEVLVNFSYEAVRRNAGALTSDVDYPAREGQVASLDRFLGGTWWHEIVDAAENEWVMKVLTGYADRVSEATGYAYITASVADSLAAQPVYELILFTRHPDGLWKMMDAMSHARKHWRERLVAQREVAKGGQAELRGLDWDDNEEAWIEEIRSNVALALRAQSRLVIEKDLGRVLGRTLGLAREKHIRSALRRLKTDGTIVEVPTGPLQKAQIARS